MVTDVAFFLGGWVAAAGFAVFAAGALLRADAAAGAGGTVFLATGRVAGTTAVQELAFTLYDGLTYVDAAVKSGLDVDAFAPQLSFFFNVHNDFFEEIAKFRAARRLWAREMEHRYHPKNPRSLQLRCHAQTAGCSLTAQQPMNNVVRTTLQALAAVLGGTQSNSPVPTNIRRL